MGNVTAGGVNDGDDDENEFYEVFIRKLYSIFCQFMWEPCPGRILTLLNMIWNIRHLLAFCKIHFIEIPIASALKVKCTILHRRVMLDLFISKHN